ncbi:MAG: hypothetical protein HQK86_11100 [Nitrospinae bacterium]|nr:hypothetical protein [Nitrospinota bacterium]MBF0633030.1 hypothetical protein [Nitrospinota bacterium]
MDSFGVILSGVIIFIFITIKKNLKITKELEIEDARFDKISQIDREFFENAGKELFENGFALQKEFHIKEINGNFYYRYFTNKDGVDCYVSQYIFSNAVSLTWIVLESNIGDFSVETTTLPNYNIYYTPEKSKCSILPQNTTVGKLVEFHTQKTKEWLDKGEQIHKTQDVFEKLKKDRRELMQLQEQMRTFTLSKTGHFYEPTFKTALKAALNIYNPFSSGFNWREIVYSYLPASLILIMGSILVVDYSFVNETKPTWLCECKARAFGLLLVTAASHSFIRFTPEQRRAAWYLLVFFIFGLFSGAHWGADYPFVIMVAVMSSFWGRVSDVYKRYRLSEVKIRWKAVLYGGVELIVWVFMFFRLVP